MAVNIRIFFSAIVRTGLPVSAEANKNHDWKSKELSSLVMSTLRTSKAYEKAEKKHNNFFGSKYVALSLDMSIFNAHFSKKNIKKYSE